MILSGDDVTYETTGRTVSANGGIIGISEGGGVFGGYDAEFDDDRRLTSDERKELADYMIARWEAFKDAGTT